MGNDMAKLYGYMVCIHECITTIPTIMYNYYAPIKTWRTKKEKYRPKKKKKKSSWILSSKRAMVSLSLLLPRYWTWVYDSVNACLMNMHYNCMEPFTVSAYFYPCSLTFFESLVWQVGIHKMIIGAWLQSKQKPNFLEQVWGRAVLLHSSHVFVYLTLKFLWQSPQHRASSVLSFSFPILSGSFKTAKVALLLLVISNTFVIIKILFSWVLPAEYQSLWLLGGSLVY